MTLREIAELLKKTELFETADPASLDELARRTRQRAFPANEALFHKSDVGVTLYVIASGSIRVESISARGETVHHAIRGPLETVGELSLLDDEPRMADAFTAEQSEILMIDKTDFLDVIHKHPNVALSLLRCLARRLRQAARHQMQQQELDVVGRLSRVLLELARKSADPGVISSLPPQHELAARIGCSRESVSRALATLERSDSIRRTGKCVRVVDPKALRQLARA